MAGAALIPAPGAAHRRRLFLRLGALVLVGAALLAVGRFTHLGSWFSSSEIRALAQRSGPFGLLIYFGLWTVGLFFHVPGLAFVAAGVSAWGHLRGGLAAYAGALLAVQFSFALVRLIGGRPLGELTQPRVVAILRTLERRPIWSVAALRSFLMSSPALNYALALSPIDWRPHLIGTALGLIPSVAVTSALFGVLFR